jgi:hypothetical protein
MKTENFDDSVRRKLESIDYSFKEQDVEHVHQYVQNNLPSFSFWKRFRQTFILSLYGITLVGLLTWNYKQFQQQEVLLKNIETLQKTIALTKSNPKRSKVPVTTAGINYLVREIENVTVLDDKEDYEIKQENNHNYIAGNYNFDKHALQNKSVKKHNKKSSTSEEMNYTYQPDQNEKFSYSKKLNFKKATINNSSRIDDSNLQSLQDAPTNLHRQEDGNEILSEKNLEPANTTTLNQLSNSSISKILEGDNLIHPDSLVKKNESDKNAVPKPNKAYRKERAKNHLSLKNLGYQAGVSIEKSNNQIGIAFLGELFVSKRFSINSGIKLLNITKEHYRDKDDFNNKRNESFCSTYIPNASDTSSISEIEMRFNIIQLPVALNYYKPLKKNYSLLFSAGTDLDLQAKFHLNYEHGDPRIHEHVATNYPNVVFNNISLSAGIQKQWNNFIVQLNPFVSPQIKNVEYKKDNLYGGLRLRVFYRFK